MEAIVKLGLYAAKIWFTSSILQQINITKYLLTYFFSAFPT